MFARNSGSAANRLQLNFAKGELYGAVSAAIHTARSGVAQGSFYTARESESEPAVFSCLTRFLPSSASPLGKCVPELFFAYKQTKKLYGCSCLVLSTGRASWEEITYHKELGYLFIILLLVLTAAPAWETGSKSCYEVPWTSRELKTCLLPGKCLSQRD